MNDGLYCADNARDPEQAAEMHRLAENGTCALCEVHIGLYTDHWTVTPNRYPYDYASRHLLLAPARHVSDPRALSEAARADFWYALDLARRTYQLPHFEMRMRCGDLRATGGTIAHLHVHIIQRADR